MTEQEKANEIASAVIKYLTAQTYNNKPLMHAIVCCDSVSQSILGRVRIQKLEKRLSMLIKSYLV